MSRCLLLIISMLFCNVLTASLREAADEYKSGNYQKAEEKLRELQIDKPYNGQINYNLGVVQYRQNKFNESIKNFLLAEKEFKDNKMLLYETVFNLANSHYKNTLAILGNDWEKKELDNKILGNAINEVKTSIEKFNSLSEKKLDDIKVQSNKKLAEELLKKLDKKQQQKNDKKSSNKEEKQNQKDKESNDQQASNKDNQNKDEEEKKSSSDKQDKNKQNDEQKNKQDEDLSNNNKQDKNEENQSSNSQNEPNKDDSSNKQDEQLKGKKNEGDNLAEGEQEDVELKGMHALLDSVQAGEEKIQKSLIRQSIKGNMYEYGQRNW